MVLPSLTVIVVCPTLFALAALTVNVPDELDGVTVTTEVSLLTAVKFPENPVSVALKFSGIPAPPLHAVPGASTATAFGLSTIAEGGVVGGVVGGIVGGVVGGEVGGVVGGVVGGAVGGVVGDVVAGAVGPVDGPLGGVGELCVGIVYVPPPHALSSAAVNMTAPVRRSGAAVHEIGFRTRDTSL